MLISKMVQIEFADSGIRAVDAIQDIRKAAEYARLNLYSRYDVQLQMPMVFEDDKVVLEVKVPEKIAGSFAVGNHLRGISSYLLKRYERYNQYIIGKRLLIYNEIPSPEMRAGKLPMIDRLEAIVKFTKLLERSDADAMDQINRIRTILQETELP